MSARRMLLRFSSWKALIYIVWYVIFGIWTYQVWVTQPDSHDALKTNVIVAALFGVPWILSLVLDCVESQVHYRVLHLSGCDIFRFAHGMEDFVAHHARTMRGTLSFYNIPLQTFRDRLKFAKIWRDAIGRNTRIDLICLLLDESLRKDWTEVVNIHREYFGDAKNIGRFRVKFRVIRKESEIEADTQLTPGHKHEFSRLLPFSYLNFGVWTGHDPRTVTNNDLVTMTAECEPWGERGNLFYFLAATQKKEICQRIREFVEREYNNAPGPEYSPSDFLNDQAVS